MAVIKQDQKPQVSPAQPAKETEAVKRDRKRIPLSVPRRKLEVPEIPGFHLHWFLESKVPLALQGGYEHVKSDEVALNTVTVGVVDPLDGNASLGTNVEVVAGDGQNLVLMKIPEEWYREDHQLLEDRNAQVVNAIFKQKKQLDERGELSPEDRAQSYVSTAEMKQVLAKGLKKVV